MKPVTCQILTRKSMPWKTNLVEIIQRGMGKGKRRDLSNQTQENVYTAKTIENFKTHVGTVHLHENVLS